VEVGKLYLSGGGLEKEICPSGISIMAGRFIESAFRIIEFLLMGGRILNLAKGADPFIHFFQADEFRPYFTKGFSMSLNRIPANHPVEPFRIPTPEGPQISYLKILRSPLAYDGRNSHFLGYENKIYFMPSLISPILDNPILETAV
jgi:hypothetical protein